MYVSGVRGKKMAKRALDAQIWLFDLYCNNSGKLYCQIDFPAQIISLSLEK